MRAALYARVSTEEQAGAYPGTRSLSSRTRRAYADEIARYEAWGRERYETHLRNGLAPASVALKLAAVNGYLAWQGEPPLAVPQVYACI